MVDLAGGSPRASRIRVLHIALNIHEGGLERVIGDLVRGIDDRGFEQHVLALLFLGRLSEGLEAHATLHVADPMTRLSMLWPSGLARQIRRIAPDVVHTHSGVWYKASLASRMAGVPYLVHTDHGRQSPDPWSARLLDGLASRRTDAIIAVSDALQRQLSETVVHDPLRIQVIPNGIDTQRFRPGAQHIRQELGIDDEAPVLGSIGRLDPIKRFDLMLDAFHQLLSRWSGSPVPALIIAGDGPERTDLRQRVADLGVEKHVHLLGWRDDVQALHATFDVFTMSSKSEGTSIGLLEAMSAELCPVVTEVGGNRAVLGDELSHRLCPTGDAQALAAAWRSALTDPQACAADGVTARRRVVECFSITLMAREHERIYRRDGGV